MEQFIFLIAFLFMLAIIGLFSSLFLTHIKDIYFVYVLFFVNFLFFDFLKLPVEPLLIISPIIFFVFLFKRNLDKLQRVIFQKHIWPFFIILILWLYWFTQKGLLPNFVFSSVDEVGSANFANYLIILCNILILLVPFYMRISINQFDKFLKILMILIVIQFLMLMIKKIFYIDFYIPFLMPYSDVVSTYLDSNTISRDGVLSEYSYLIVLFGLFFISSKYRFIVVFFVITANLLLGGGRIDLVSSLFVVTLYYLFFVRQQKNFVTFFSYSTLIILIFGVSIYFISDLMTLEQNNRFYELLNLKDAKELDASRSNVRASMWSFAFNGFIESPLIGNGISNDNITSFDNVSERNVSTGGAHQTYLSILYVFGLLGFISFIIALRKVMLKLIAIRKLNPQNRIFSFLFIYFIVLIFLRFNLGGGLNTLELSFYFFSGYVLSFSPRNRIN